MFTDRVLSGMRPTGRMHLGHYHGALKNWVRLQEEYECLYFAADWHALTTHYDEPEAIAESVWEMFIDWLAVGINPARATVFIQSHVPEHAELTLLLGMIAPVGWLERARDMLDQAQNLALGDRERLFGYLEGSRRVILPEPRPLLTETPKVPGLDGQKMSKSYGNAILLREEPESIAKKVRTMQTDPARVHRSDPGTPEKCPVWSLHKIYSDQARQAWVQKGCTTAGIGCLECKQPVIDAIIAEQEPIKERAQKYLDDPSLVRAIVADGCERARKLAEETMRDVREVMGLAYT